MEQGVIVSYREMYQNQQQALQEIRRLGGKVESLEETVKTLIRSDERNREAIKTALVRADERSREALEAAKDATDEAKNAHRRIRRVEEKVEKIMMSIILAVITGAVGALFFFAQRGLGG